MGLKEATAINMIDMVGIGPFITIPFIIGAMNGPQCIIAWILGAFLSFMDGFVWAELGAAFPKAGGSYVFLQKLFGEKWGKLFAFLFTWQTSIQAPLVIASGAIGFSKYLGFILPLNSLGQKAASGSLVILIFILLYRNIKSVGKISMVMWVVVAGTLLWLIYAGLSHFNSSLAFSFPDHAFDITPAFFLGLGLASTKTIYSFLGYYNVCHLGAEIRDPEKNIPKSIFISITGIAILYLLMQISVLGVIPWQKAKDSEFIVSTFFQQIYGEKTAVLATGLILFIALASLFSVTLGYSRVLFAAAEQGDFFKPFAMIHPEKKIPHVSLFVLCSVAFVFSLLFRLGEIITAIIVMRILVQFIGQAAGLIAFRYRNKGQVFPFKMWLFPVPAVLSILIWSFIFFTSGWVYIAGAIGVISTGMILFSFRTDPEPGT